MKIQASDVIKPDSQNPLYWQYKSKPVVLLGGSVEDNVFQIGNIEEHLDTLAACGGNYLRCTMSSRDDGDVWPFDKDPESGKYDLERPGTEYWKRFERFLSLCLERDIIVQFEIWDRFDFSNHRGPVWTANPYNPASNINYTADESGLAEDILTHPGRKENAFFRTVPELDNNKVVLKYQKLQVDKMLSISLNYPNVLYCMDNETNESALWGKFWSEYIKQKASEAGVTAQTTEMWDAHDLNDHTHRQSWEHPETYSFCDISQNNHNQGNKHWDNLQAFRQNIIESGHLRPINTVKIYGCNTGQYGSSRDGQERFWRNILGGLASTRFHRPPAGLGLSETSQAHIKSMRMVLAEIDIFNCQPTTDIFANRSPNECFAAIIPGKQYAVFFCDGGEVNMNLGDFAEKEICVKWLDILKSQWQSESILPVTASGDKKSCTLKTPKPSGYWAAVVKAAKK